MSTVRMIQSVIVGANNNKAIKAFMYFILYQDIVASKAHAPKIEPAAIIATKVPVTTNSNNLSLISCSLLVRAIIVLVLVGSLLSMHIHLGTSELIQVP